MVAQPVNMPGNGGGISGPAFAQAAPRPQVPVQRSGMSDAPSPQDLRAAWQAYNGTYSQDGRSGLLAAEADVPDLNIPSNRLRGIVNTGVDFLFGPELAMTTENARAQAIIDAVWGDDDLRMTLLSKSGINGGVYGHVFFKVVPPKRGKPSALNPPRLVLLNPEMVTPEVDPDDADLVARFVIEYATTDAQGNPLRKRQTITRIDPDDDDDSVASGMDSDTSWEVQDWEARGSLGNNWKTVGDPKEWAYELPPIIDWQNYPNPNTHWGQPDITPTLIRLQRQLCLAESCINKAGYLQGTPYMYSTGTDTGGIRPTPGKIIDLGAPDAKLAAVNGAGNLDQLMNFADQLRSDMDEESGIPSVALGRMKDMPRGQVTGIGMRLLHASALSRNEHKRRLYGQGIIQICQTVLVLCGMSMDEVDNLDIELTWQDPLPNDDLAQAQAAVALQSIGYSNATLIERTGGDPELEEQRKQEEQQAQVTAFAQGKGMPPTTPPMPPNMPPNMSPDAATAKSDGATPAGGASQGPAPKQGNMAALNSPKAQQMRANMKQMAGS